MTRRSRTAVPWEQLFPTPLFWWCLGIAIVWRLIDAAKTRYTTVSGVDDNTTLVQFDLPLLVLAVAFIVLVIASGLTTRWFTPITTGLAALWGSPFVSVIILKAISVVVPARRKDPRLRALARAMARHDILMIELAIAAEQAECARGAASPQTPRPHERTRPAIASASTHVEQTAPAPPAQPNGLPASKLANVDTDFPPVARAAPSSQRIL
jgi:hypothetical protein